MENANQPQLPASPGGRDGKGRFAVGNRLAKGNPVNRRISAYRAMAMKSVTPMQWGDVVEAMMKLAIDGDVQAATWLRDTLIGKPKQAIEVDANVNTRAHATVVRELIVSDPDALELALRLESRLHESGGLSRDSDRN